MALDGDASLLLKIHIVEHLSLNDLDGIGIFQKPVASVDLPWSMCAMMQKFLIFSIRVL